MKYSIIILLLAGINLYPQNFIWKNPLPQGKNINHSQVINQNTVIACGDEGLLIKTTNGGEEWQTLQRVTMRDLNSLFFKDELNGFIVGSAGIIIKTTDGGLNFEILDDNKTYDLNSIVIINQNILIAGSNGKFKKSSDDGINWITVELSNSRSISDLFFLSESKGWMVGENGMLRFTEDIGTTWMDKESSTNALLSSIFFINDQIGFATGINGTILKSTNGGNNWFKINLEFSNWLKSIIFFDEYNGIVVGQPGIILTTSDQGMNWTSSADADEFKFNDISLFNSSAWVFGEIGTILKTSNKGSEWEFQSSGIFNQFNDVHFLNEEVCWIVGSDGLAIKTEDGGDTWQSVITNVQTSLNSVFFSNELLGSIVGNDATLITTIDGGQTWVRENLSRISQSTHLYAIAINQFSRRIIGSGGICVQWLPINEDGDMDWVPIMSGGYDLNALFSIWEGRQTVFVGNNGTARFVYNRWEGITINPIQMPAIYDLEDVFYSNLNTGWIVGKYGAVFKTYSRTNYDLINLLPVNRLNTVFFVDSLTGYTGGTSGSIFKTTDGGFNWTRINSGITNEITKIHFISESTGFIIGTNGLIMKIEDGSGSPSFTELDENPIISNFELYQNYPNPFNPSTTIRYQIPESGIVTIKVYDLLGKEVSTLVNDYKAAGTHDVIFNAEELSSGIYFYSLQSGNFMKTKSMTVLK